MLFKQSTLSHSHKTKITRALAALAILPVSAFIASQIPSSASAIDVNYQQVFSDDFNRADATGTAIGNGWTFPGGHNCNGIRPNPAAGVNTWKIVNNALLGTAGNCNDTANGGNAYAYQSSPILQSDYNIYNGKVTFDYNTANSGPYTTSGILARYNPTDGSGIFFGFYETTDNQIGNLIVKLLRPGSFGDPNRTNYYTELTFQLINEVLPSHLQVEVLLQNEDWELNVYDKDTSLTDPIYTNQGTNRSIANLTGRTWGLQSFSWANPYDNFVLYKDPASLLTTTTGVVKTGDAIPYTIIGDESRTLTNFTDGAGGTFSPSSIQLTQDNNYTAAVTYTPARNGRHTVTADATGSETFRSEILAQPYSTKIGMLGGSITDYSVWQINNGLRPINTSVCGGTARELAANAISGTKCGGLAGAQNAGDPWRTLAIDTMLEEGVDIIHLMIGTNDVGASRTPQQFKTDMQTSIDAFKAAGFKHIIISKLIWRDDIANINTRILQYNTVIDELIADNSGYALLGDTDAYAWFEADNRANMTDGLHPSIGLGRQTLAKFWAAAITRNLEYQIAPDHAWVNGDNTHVLNEETTITHTTDKHFDTFANIVKIDGVTLAPSDYTATTGSTIIELSNATLNSLSAGSHTLTVYFYGDVTVSSNFAIAADPQSVCQNGATNFPACDNNPPSDNNPLNVPNTGAQTVSQSISSATTGSALSLLAAVILIPGAILAKRKLTKQL